MPLSIGGLGTGLDTAGIVAQLMATERIPQNKIAQRGQVAQQRVAAWNDLRAKMQALTTAAEAVRTPSKAVGATATSSNAAAVAVRAGDGSQLGQTSLIVQRLATAQQRRIDGLGPASMTVGAATSILTAGRLGGVEGRTLLDLSDATTGTHTVSVTRASSAAVAYGTLPAGVSPGDLSVTLAGGSTTNVSLSASYPAANGANSLLEDLQTQLNGVAVVSEVGGRLQIKTLDQGSAQSLVFGGAAATALALPTTAVTGQSALLLVNGKRQEVEPEPGGGTREVALGDTGITLTMGAGLGLGTVKANVVRTTETTTLSELQGMLSATGSPVSASLIADVNGVNSLVMSSTATGEQGGVHIQAGHTVLDRPGSTTTTNGVDAQVVIGGITTTRSSNTLTDVVPGLTIDLLHKPPLDASGNDVPITLGVARDSSGTKDKVKALVDAMNAVLTLVKTSTKYDVGTGTGGPLVGNGVARSLSSNIFSKASITASNELRTLAQLGIQSNRDGTFDFKAEELTAALEKSPDDVAKALSGMADGLATWAKDASRTGGLLTTQREGADSEVTQRRAQFDAFEERLKRTEARYRRQFSALETAVSRLNSQSGYVSSAIAGLGT